MNMTPTDGLSTIQGLWNMGSIRISWIPLCGCVYVCVCVYNVCVIVCVCVCARVFYLFCHLYRW